jgi:Sulfotransferase family
VRAIFICGCGHSGTTLLATMFAAHPQVFVPLRETNTFLKREGAVERYERLRDAGLESGKAYLVEKTPRHVRHLDLIREVADEPRFVVPVRDGRDVTASIKDRYTAAMGAGRWISDNAIVLAERDREDVHVYRHEDLVAQPQATLEEICEGVALPFDRAMLDYHTREHLWYGLQDVSVPDGTETSHGVRRNWQVNQPIFDSSGRWETDLDEEEIEPLLVGEGRRVMEAFGYLP